MDWIPTIASVMPRQIPEPPPVQNRTFPLKISSLNMVVEATAGRTSFGIVRTMLANETPGRQRCVRSKQDACGAIMTFVVVRREQRLADDAAGNGANGKGCAGSTYASQVKFPKFPTTSRMHTPTTYRHWAVELPR